MQSRMLIAHSRTRPDKRLLRYMKSQCCHKLYPDDFRTQALIMKDHSIYLTRGTSQL